MWSVCALLYSKTQTHKALFSMTLTATPNSGSGLNWPAWLLVSVATVTCRKTDGNFCHRSPRTTPTPSQSPNLPGLFMSARRPLAMDGARPSCCLQPTHTLKALKSYCLISSLILSSTSLLDSDDFALEFVRTGERTLLSFCVQKPSNLKIRHALSSSLITDVLLRL